MLPRQLIPFSLRHCKCLFISILFVCAVLALTAIHYHPNLLVNETPQFQQTAKVVHRSVASFQAEEAKPNEPQSYNHVSMENTDILKDNEDEIQSKIQQVHFPGESSRGLSLPQDEVHERKPAVVEPFVPERRLVHFDLKGAPPKMEYLLKLIPMFVKLGATGLLVEYEEMFPYEGVLESTAASNHYTKAEINSLLEAARVNGLDVIPLVQTFGHLEYVLKSDKFDQLRENPAVPQAICPSKSESFTLVQNLIDQIMAFHPNIRYLHIGCDEVYHIAECALCQRKFKDDIFLAHVQRVATYVKNKYKNVIPIIWDDMLRHISASTLREYKLGELVEPMVWVYAEDVYRFAGVNVFEQFSQVFPSYWVASAFKGAFGETFVVPDVNRHLQNNLNWLQVARSESSKFDEGLRGMVITGWQRFDHFAVLCELLPAAIPSLAVTLLTASKGYYNQSLAHSLYSALSCSPSAKYEEMPDLQYDRFLYDKMIMCYFPGAAFYRLTGRFIRIEKEIDEYYETITRKRGWLTEYNARHNFSSPARIDELTRDLHYLGGSLNSLAKQTVDAMKNIFDGYTVSEWMEQKLLPLFEKMDRIEKNAQQLVKPSHWANRPLKPYDRWQYYGVDFKIPNLFNNNQLNSRSPLSTPLAIT